MAKQDLRPAALVAGAVVLGGIVFFSVQKKRGCSNLPNIWAKEGPLHLTQEAQDEAFELARYKLREYMLDEKAEYKLSDIQMYVADSLRDCSWEKLETQHQKDVWRGIGQIVNEVNQRAEQDPDGFLKSF